MADIDIQSVYNDKAREFKSEGQGSGRFESDFVSAANAATRRINRQADLETRISMVTAPNGTIGLSYEYQDVFEDLVTLSLIQKGQKRRNEDADVVDLRRNIDERIDMIRQDILVQAVDADTDNETDFVALGAGTGGVDTGGENA